MKKMKVIDLSKTIYTGMDVFPGDPEVKIDIVHTHEKDTWELRNLSMGSHTGTHVDAYSHMHKGKETLDEIGIAELDRIVDLKPGFIGGNITEDLERALLDHNIITYTELINLDLIPKMKTFMFYGFPLKIKSGDGSPVRAVAIIEE